ncbi:hypothetical protein BAURA86_02359 [Brevibacterium aurantiacum]|uniref:Uncharacterized protein n=1 Tax=Brevibacterium aurantiacum TaxID=273384 RepID=A0A2H1JXA9_BREAU|nr:hypothetical protein BAUR9175_02893 [Brevibacterium aurantiacum]SMX94209.1 hypothetical protein BAURA86_02359 [Brevibacterium aurantiacum]
MSSTHLSTSESGGPTLHRGDHLASTGDATTGSFDTKWSALLFWLRTVADA